MQATIYVTAETFSVINSIKHLSHSERMLLSDDAETDLTNKAGYFLKYGNQMRFAVLPASAIVGAVLTPDEPEIYHRHVAFPTNLRGCLFEKAPLPDGYGGIVTYWSGLPFNSNTSGAVYYQNPQNEYMVDISALDAAEGEPVAVAAASLVMDKLLSEGVVVSIRDVESLTANLSTHHFIELKVPVQPMLGIESDDFRSDKDYAADPSQQYERVWIKCADILCSPDRDRIYIDLIRHELLSYGYWY